MTKILEVGRVRTLEQTLDARDEMVTRDAKDEENSNPIDFRSADVENPVISEFETTYYGRTSA